MARIVILGAGLTGLSTAYHLEQSGCTDYLLFEKEPNPGGLCRSIQKNGFTFDYTGHLLHSNDAATRPLVDLFVGKDNLATATRSAWIESNNIQTPYPFQMYLHGRSPKVIAECIEGFVSRPQTQKQTRMFTDWVNRSFGEGFGKHFFYPYQRKIFSYPPRKLTSTWTGRFVPKTDLATIIRGALTPHTADNIGYNATFLYPKSGGINTLITGLVQQLTQPILTGFCATNIDTSRKVITFANGHQEPYEQLVNTLPLNKLLPLLKGVHTQSLQSAASNLLCTSVLNINLGVSGNHLPNTSWTYYPDSTSPWYRVGFPHSFSKSACPTGAQSLYAEISYLKKPQNVTRALAKAEQELLKTFGLPQEAIIARAPLLLDHAYVIYNAWRDKYVPRILNRLESNYALHSIGRYGAWKYASMQEALVDGKTTAHTLIKKFKPAYLSKDGYEAPSNSVPLSDKHPIIIPSHLNGDEHEA